MRYSDMMANFFKHAPVKETDQKRFLDAVLHKRHMILSVPLGYSTVSLYALAAMMSDGLTIAVCPGSRHIRRNLDYFRNAGFKFPEIAYLDGTQMPHEERTIQQEINHHRVRLLYVTPERFVSLTFLQILVHNNITFLLVEEADRLLPGVSGGTSYKKLYNDGLAQLRQLPPLVLVTPPMAPLRFKELGDRLKLPPLQLVQIPPAVEPLEIKVKCLFSEAQKYHTLVNLLSGSPSPGKTGRLDGFGAVLIQTAFPAQAEKLGASLIDYGFDPVFVVHHKKPEKDQLQALEAANALPNSIIVNAGVEMRHWDPPAEAVSRVVFWTPPLGVDDLIVQTFREQQKREPREARESMAQQTPDAPEHPRRQGLVFHTREDFQDALKRLQFSRKLDLNEIQEHMTALKHYRCWILSDGCRLQSLAAYLQGTSTIEVPSCGCCDRCTEKQTAWPVLRRWLRRWCF